MRRINAQPTFTDLTVAGLGSPRAQAFFDVCLRKIPSSNWPRPWPTSLMTTTPPAAGRTGPLPGASWRESATAGCVGRRS